MMDYDDFDQLVHSVLVCGFRAPRAFHYWLYINDYLGALAEDYLKRAEAGHSITRMQIDLNIELGNIYQMYEDERGTDGL